MTIFAHFIEIFISIMKPQEIYSNKSSNKTSF